MYKLKLTEEDILTTMNEWETGESTAINTNVLNDILNNPELENEIPQLIEDTKDFPDRNISITVYYTTSIDRATPKPTVRASIHWVSTKPMHTSQPDTTIKKDWLKPASQPDEVTHKEIYNVIEYILSFNYPFAAEEITKFIISLLGNKSEEWIKKHLPEKYKQYLQEIFKEEEKRRLQK